MCTKKPNSCYKTMKVQLQMINTRSTMSFYTFSFCLSDSAMRFELVRNRQDQISCSQVNPTVSQWLPKETSALARWHVEGRLTWIDAVRWLVAVMCRVWHWAVLLLCNKPFTMIHLQTEEKPEVKTFSVLHWQNARFTVMNMYSHCKATKKHVIV